MYYITNYKSQNKLLFTIKPCYQYKLKGQQLYACLNTGNIGQIPTWVEIGANLGNNNSQLLKLGYSWKKVGFYFKS